MHFSANLSMLFTEHDFRDRFAAAKASGFDAVEFWFPFQYGGLELVLPAQEAGVQVILFNLDPGDMSLGEWGTLGVPGREDHFKRSFEMSIGLADHFRCSLLHLLAGRIPEAITREKCWETAFENLLWASQQSPAEATLVVEAINPHDMPGFILPKPADALSLVKQINHPSIRLLYDIYHAYRVGEDVMRTLRQERDWIAHIQIADHPGRHQPGTGEIPFEAIFNTLQEIDYPGYIGLEYRPSGSTKASLSWLQNRMAD